VLIDVSPRAIMLNMKDGIQDTDWTAPAYTSKGKKNGRSVSPSLFSTTSKRRNIMPTKRCNVAKAKANKQQNLPDIKSISGWLTKNKQHTGKNQTAAYYEGYTVYERHSESKGII
jgi:hypothetical protein